MSTRRSKLLATTLALALPVIVASNATAVPNTFVNGTVADADDVNENFSSLEARIIAIEVELGISDRFVACPGGTAVADIETGLLWEEKTGTPGGLVDCTSAAVCPDAHDVNNLYTWSSTGLLSDGLAYTVFLADLNTAPGFEGRTDWRLPIISELQSVMVGPGVTSTAPAAVDPLAGANPTGQATTCSAAPCIDPGFAAVGGPTASSDYWSESSSAPGPFTAWGASFALGDVGGFLKTDGLAVRAVRTGSCFD